MNEIVINTHKIKYAFHDIDGTHSLIRDWPPVMSICLYDVIKNGLPEDFDSIKNQKRLISLAGTMKLPETDQFCIESAGLSALTQMEGFVCCRCRSILVRNAITKKCPLPERHFLSD